MDMLLRGQVHPTALVSVRAVLGEGVTVGPFALIHGGVEVGDGSFIGSHSVLGESTADYYGGETTFPTTRIGADAIVRSHSVIYTGASIGSGFRSGHHVTIREGSIIGNDVQVGTMSDLQGDLSVGDHARIHSNVFIAQLTTIEDFVWLFPHVLLANDPHPPSDTCTRGAIVRRFAVVATRSTVMPGVEIGEHALVGAMSLVNRDVDPETVVFGSPARDRGSVRDVQCTHGGLDAVYPWPTQFRRGYGPGVLPDVEEFR